MTIQGTVKNGQVVLDPPFDLPDGTRVEVVPVPDDRPSVGMREEDWPTTPEGIAALLKRMEEREPLDMTAEDEAAWKAALQERKDAEKARFFEHADELKRMWE